MDFFDCNIAYGRDVEERCPRPAHDVRTVRREMARAGVRRGLVWHLEQWTAGPAVGNQLLADDLRGADDLYGLWALLPSHTREIPPPDRMAQEMRQHRIVGWKLFPAVHRYMPRSFVLGDWLGLAVERRIPVFINTAHGTTLNEAADLLEGHPDLIVVLSDGTVWPNDRILRPFVAAFSHVYLDLTQVITEGGIADFVAAYGADRLLYGSGFPHGYFGANMLTIRHARIDEAQKAAIAGGNLAAIIDGIRL